MPNSQFQTQANELGQKLNAQFRQAKKEFELKEFENKSSDGLMSVVVTGQREVKTLSLIYPCLWIKRNWKGY
ncbi:YbaB/EbfC family nucleoid-associated protein [Methylobacter tundripaludum]